MADDPFDELTAAVEARRRLPPRTGDPLTDLSRAAYVARGSYSPSYERDRRLQRARLHVRLLWFTIAVLMIAAGCTAWYFYDRTQPPQPIAPATATAPARPQPPPPEAKPKNPAIGDPLYHRRGMRD